MLRIYGPQVEHLIDRDAELQVLRRLGRQNIGPRLLGTFNNGRFEEYLYAKPLQPIDLRQPEVSRQIAKRMRELHDGIELTKEERRNGPFVWRNWDKWVGRCEKIVSYIDGQVLARGATSSAIKRLRERGFVCGTPWVEFRHVVERYRNELNKIYGGSDQLKHELIFAHNDVSSIVPRENISRANEMRRLSTAIYFARSLQENLPSYFRPTFISSSLLSTLNIQTQTREVSSSQTILCVHVGFISFNMSASFLPNYRLNGVTITIIPIRRLSVKHRTIPPLKSSVVSSTRI